MPSATHSSLWKSIAGLLAGVLFTVVTAWTGYVTTKVMALSEQVTTLQRTMDGMSKDVEKIETVVNNLGTRTNWLDFVTQAGSRPEATGAKPYPPGIIEPGPIVKK